MTISTQTRTVLYDGNGAATVFAYPFKISAATDLKVYLRNVATGGFDLQTLTTHYSVSGVGNPGGGNITFVTAPASGVQNVSIVRKTDITQLVDYVTNDDFPAEVHEGALDKLTAIDQDQQDLIQRAVRMPDTDPLSLRMELPEAALRAGKFLGFNSLGEALVSSATNVSSSGDLNFTPLGSGAVSRTVQDKLHETVSVFDFMTAVQKNAVRNNTVLDVTSAVQAAINYIEAVREGRLVFPAGDYRVTQITLGASGQRLGTTYEFQNANIVGIASTATKSIVQLKCGSANILNMAVAGGQNANYECGVHWYTNDVNTYYPGLNRIDGMLVSGCVIGLCIGALPSQADPIPAQGTVQANGIATDAPLSECYVGGLRFQDCIKDVYMRQPNGKLTFVSPTLSPTNAAWSGSGVSAEANVTALTINSDGSELTILGGFVENIDDAAGSLVDAFGGTLNIIGAVLESKCPIRISGVANLRMSNIMNWGLNSASSQFFQVLDTATGCLDLSDMFLLRGYGSATVQPLVKVVSSFASGSASINGKFWVNGSQVRFSDPNFTQGSTFNPLVFGCRSKFSNCWITNHSGLGVRLSQYKLDEGQNLLTGKVDIPADVITAYGANGTGVTVGGWTFSTPSGASWGRDGSSLPTIEGVTPNNALRLTANGGGGTVYCTSPKFPVEPQRFYLIKGWCKTNGAGSQIIFRLNWYDFGSGAASTASTDAFSGGVAIGAGTTWAPFMLWAQAPKDATQAELMIYAENGAEIWTLNLEVV